MWTRAVGATLHGIEGILISVEVDSGQGLPCFQMVGQADSVVREGRDRVRAAFRAARFKFPQGRVIVNLAPSELPKTGSGLDLAIAVALVAATEEIPDARLRRTLLLGEVGLDGSVRPVRGTLSLVAAAQQAGIEEAIVPVESLAEGSTCPGIRTWGASELRRAVAFLQGHGELEPAGERPSVDARAYPALRDLSEVRGQAPAKRALEVAGAGSHNVLFVGPPGSGKTLLAQCLPGLLPDLHFDDAMETTRVHSVAGTLGRTPLLL